MPVRSNLRKVTRMTAGAWAAVHMAPAVREQRERDGCSSPALVMQARTPACGMDLPTAVTWPRNSLTGLPEAGPSVLLRPLVLAIFTVTLSYRTAVALPTPPPATFSDPQQGTGSSKQGTCGA